MDSTVGLFFLVPYLNLLPLSVASMQQMDS